MRCDVIVYPETGFCTVRQWMILFAGSCDYEMVILGLWPDNGISAEADKRRKNYA